MPRREAAIVIRRPLRTVFPFVANAENACRFRADVVAVRRTSGTPAAPGATYRQIVKLGWRQAEVLLENSEYEPGRTLSFIAHRPGGARMRTTFSFRTIESEHTRVAVTAERDRCGRGRLGRQLEKREVEALGELKRALESRPFTL